MLKYVDYDIVFQELPDEITLAINISGCVCGCEGCHSPHLMEDIGEFLTYEVLERLMKKYKTAISCICFMGGDREPKEVERLARYVKLKGLKTGWYSGSEKLGCSEEVFDYIKLGRYVQTLGGLNSSITNQRLYSKTSAGEWQDITERFWRY